MYDLTSLQREANKALGFTPPRHYQPPRRLRNAQGHYLSAHGQQVSAAGHGWARADGAEQPKRSYQPLVENIPRKDDGKLPMPARI